MNVPRLLPLVGVALGGVIALKAASGVGDVPRLIGGAKAFAEGVVSPKSAGGPASSAPPLPPSLGPSGQVASAASGQAATPAPIACGAKAADLAREAGLSPAELQVLQSLGARRGQLDQREQDIDTQSQLLAAAEAKLDAKLQALSKMKGDIQALLNQADQQNEAELEKLVIVYSQMKPRDAAARMTLLDDSVRLPIAAKMKERNLSAILGQMAPADAKALTEKLAARLENKTIADARAALSGQAPPPSPQPGAQAAAAPPAGAGPTQAAANGAPAKVAKAGGRKSRRKPASQQAANSPPATAAASPAKSG